MGYTFFDAPMVGSTLQPTMLLNVLLLLLPKILGFMFRVNKHIFYRHPCNQSFVPMDQYYVLHGWGLHLINVIIVDLTQANLILQVAIAWGVTIMIVASTKDKI